MHTSRTLLLLTLATLALPVAARKSCEELQAEIDARIKANGVPEYTLAIIAAAEEANADGKIVGSCEGGEKRIVYKRGEAAAATAGSGTATAEDEG